jgi:hypothetical protein
MIRVTIVTRPMGARLVSRFSSAATGIVDAGTATSEGGRRVAPDEEE